MLCNSLAEVTLLFVKKGFKLVESDYKDTGEVFFSLHCLFQIAHCLSIKS